MTKVYTWVATFEHGADLTVRATHWSAALESALDSLVNDPDRDNLISLTVQEFTTRQTDPVEFLPTWSRNGGF